MPTTILLHCADGKLNSSWRNWRWDHLAQHGWPRRCWPGMYPSHPWLHAQCPQSCQIRAVGSGGGGRQNLYGPKPGFYAARPSGDREGGPAEAVAVSTLSIDVHLRRNLGVLKGQEVDNGIFNMHPIV